MKQEGILKHEKQASEFEDWKKDALAYFGGEMELRVPTEKNKYRVDSQPIEFARWTKIISILGKEKPIGKMGEMFIFPDKYPNYHYDTSVGVPRLEQDFSVSREGEISSLWRLKDAIAISRDGGRGQILFSDLPDGWKADDEHPDTAYPIELIDKARDEEIAG